MKEIGIFSDNISNLVINYQNKNWDNEKLSLKRRYFTGTAILAGATAATCLAFPNAANGIIPLASVALLCYSGGHLKEKDIFHDYYLEQKDKNIDNIDEFVKNFNEAIIDSPIDIDTILNSEIVYDFENMNEISYICFNDNDGNRKIISQIPLDNYNSYFYNLFDDVNSDNNVKKRIKIVD